MDRINSNPNVGLAKKVLCWITFAHRPLTIGALQHAVVIQPGAEDINTEALTDESDLVSLCAGLVLVEKESRLVCLVRKFFLKIRQSSLNSK